MKSFLHKAGAVAVVLVLCTGTARSQDLGQQLSTLGSDAAIQYTTPFLQGIGSSLNSAFYHSADLHDILGFDIGLKLGITSFQDADKTYQFKMPSSLSYNTGFGTVNLQSGIDYPAEVTANTFVGSKEQVTVRTLPTSTLVPANTPLLTIVGGQDISALPMPMPQAALGLPFGIEVIGRFIPEQDLGDAGKFNYTGFGLRYDVDQWLPLFPVDIAVHFATQSMTFKDKNGGETFSASTKAYGVEVSKKLIFITAYAGFQLESSTMTVAGYTYNDPFTGNAISINGFEIDGKNSSRFTVGLRMLLLILNVHAEYSIASQPVVALGAGISIR